MIFAFQDIPVPQRQNKPRTRGITMMIDWGIPINQQHDILECQGHLIDKAKIAGGIPRFMPPELLRKKTRAYRDAGISVANGGLFTELTLMQGLYDPMLAEMCDMGFDAIEISENLIPLNAKDKTKAVRHALENYGLTVIGEVGRKEGEMTDDEIVEDVELYLNAGANSVYLEAAEMFDAQGPRAELIHRLNDQFPSEALIYELPVDIIPGFTPAMKHAMASQMVATLGTEVNLANVEHYEVYLLECVRRGVGGDTRHAGGAMRMAMAATEAR